MEICLNKKPGPSEGHVTLYIARFRNKLSDKIVKLAADLWDNHVAVSKNFEGADKNYYMHFVRGKAQARLGSTWEFPNSSVVKNWWFHS